MYKNILPSSLLCHNLPSSLSDNIKELLKKSNPPILQESDTGD